MHERERERTPLPELRDVGAEARLVPAAALSAGSSQREPMVPAIAGRVGIGAFYRDKPVQPPELGDAGLAADSLFEPLAGIVEGHLLVVPLGAVE